jgi:hypothetical protein
LATPAGAEKLFVELSGASIKGGLPQLAAATRCHPMLLKRTKQYCLDISVR